jgi:hypothetical protein
MLSPVARCACESLWTITSASVAGAYHLEQDLQGDDAHAWAETDGDGIVFAVADGVGSARHAAEGALMAVEIAVNDLLFSKSLRQALSGPDALALFPDIFHHVAREISTFAESTVEMTAESLAATLCIGVITPSWTAAAQIGDGAVIVRGAESGELQLLLAPQRLEYAGLVHSATIARSEERLRSILSSAHCGSVTGLAATTDGLIDLSLSTDHSEPHGPFFAPLFSTVDANPDRLQLDGSLTEFLHSERVAKAARDDLTLLLVTSRTPSPPGDAVLDG